MSRQKSLTLIAVAMSLLSTLLVAAAQDTPFQRVPANQRVRTNPFENDSQAAQAGAKLFRQHCASCHGSNAEGKRDKPDLHSESVRSATPGELQWLLTNGSMGNGMPSWSRLPEQQRWQLVTFLKTLK
jgi:mono/diheme cytochrome c family protein